jgi:hypothetical protein
MNTNRPQAQKLDSVGTFYVILLVVLAAIAVGTYVALTEIIPAVHNFMDTLAQAPVQPHKTH